MLITGRPHGLKLSGQHLLAFNNAIELAGKHLPTEFNRIPRKADALKKWKATEFRTFLLYIGPSPKPEFDASCLIFLFRRHLLVRLLTEESQSALKKRLLAEVLENV